MDLVIHGLVCLFFLACTPFPLCRAQQTFFPVSVPLAVRSPYLLSYLSTQNGSLHSNLRPHTLGIDEIGWNGLVKIDNGTTYLWLGDSRVVTGTTNTVLKELTVTPTRTIFTIDAGPLELNITFLSPIEPGDFVKQSIPFSYLSFEARSTDGSPHHVQVYTGITGEWLDPDHSQNHTWTTAQTSNGSQIHSFQHATPREFTENVGLASWGVTYRIGMAEPNPALFLAQGSLDNSVDPGSPRIIQGGNINYTSLTFAHDLGTIQSTSTPVVWAIGATFDSDSTAAALYQDLSGNPAQRRSLYYVSQYSDDHTLIDDFLNDYPAALDRSIKLDANLTSAASAIVPGPNYSDIIALASRQVLGATWLTISKGSDGSWNTSDVLMYWRDQGAGPPELLFSQLNPPDGLYASFPLFLYLDPSFGAPLLEPLLRFQASSAYTNPYAAASVGGQWPNMTASNTLHSQGIEQSANMVILSYAQARSAGDTSLVSRHYQLLKSWTDYIINPTVSTTAVFNNGQMSADGLNIANQTNLAIKGIIAVKAMSMLASLTGNSADATTYLNKSQDLYTQWKSNAFASDGHMLLAYGDETASFSLGYNVFADLWLGTGVVDSGVTSVLSGQVNNLFSFSPQTSQYGVAIDSNAPDKVRSSWNMFIAAAVNDTKTRSAIISRVHARASLNSTADILQFPLDWSSTNASGIFAPAT
ncbi:hypothetical protein OF83DRAFT_1067104 [Amylostereum chailletii]|nr:hypothetical protein OF83DRAFT_1067104 [Amylostereum chailletii]